MAVIRAKNEADYAFKAGAYGGDKLKVVAFSGNEGISELFHYSVELASTDGGVDFDKIIGKPGLLTIQGDKGKRYVHGIVNQFEQTGKEGKWTYYHAGIVPTFWLLSQRADCRIFQNQPIPDIIKEALKGLDARFSLKGTYHPREYCVQYRESDLAFVSRLMEEYGLFYFFEHTADKDVMVIGDDPVVHVAIPDPAKVIYRAPGTTAVSAQEHVSEYHWRQEIRSGAATLRDYDFKKPSLTLEQESKAKEKAEGEDKLEVYDYPGKYVLPAEGGDLAKVHLESLRATRRLGSGRSDCRRFIPGYRFTLDKFDRSEFNREYLLIRISQSGSQPQVLGADAKDGGQTSYENHFECIPSDTPFRPARVTPRPSIQGSQSAVVVGPGGEEIYTDEHGRVKVQFPWDRQGKKDEKSSCWVRVKQAWAGEGWGMVFLPRIGQEVLVEFMEGDPDRPVITGSLYNGTNTPPYALPAEKTKSAIKSNSSKGGGGSNEIRFEDAKGSEEIYLHGQKDWNIHIENNKAQQIGNDEALTVGHDRTKTVNHDQTETVVNNKTINVGVNHTETIGSNMSLTVGSNKTELVTVNSAETVGAAKEMTVGGLFQVTVGGAMNETVAGAKAEEVGAFKGETVGGNKSEAIGGNRSLTTGGDLTETIGKGRKVKIGQDLTETVGGKHTETVSKEYAVNAKKIQLAAEEQLTLKAGDAEIVLKKNGDILVKGNKIQIKGDGDVIIKGSKIVEN